MSNSFIFYDSFLDTILKAPESIQLELFKGIANCGLGRQTVNDIQYPASLFVTQAMASVNAAHDRYEKAVSDGEKGGRPKKWIDREEAEKLYAELKSWKAVAETLDVDEDTLRKARSAWSRKTEKPKNLNVNNNVNENVNVNDNSQLTLINKGVSAQPKAALPPKEPKVRWEVIQDENGNTRFIKHVYDGGSETK